MSNDTTPCANGCVTRHGDTNYPTPTDGRALICPACETRLETWLKHIPDNYALLPTFIEHGTTDGNPESKSTKRAEAAAPMRLEVIDLMDTRLGRKWNGTAPAHDRRGVIGTLRVHVERLIDDKPLTATKWADTSVAAACNLLLRHRIWLAEQDDWITFMYDDLDKLNRTLSDAVGDYKKPAVGLCEVVPDEAEKPCGGKLFPQTNGSVRCAKCHDTWPPDKLARLGLLLAEAIETTDWRTDDECVQELLDRGTSINATTVRVWASKGRIRKSRHTGRTLYALDDVIRRAS